MQRTLSLFVWDKFLDLSHAFFTFNLKSSLRARTTMLMAGRLVLAGLLAGLSAGHSHPP